MEKTRLIEVPIEEARDLVKPEKLEDVLEVLVKAGLLDEYCVGEHKLFIFPKVGRQLETSLFFASLPSLQPIAKGKAK